MLADLRQWRSMTVRWAFWRGRPSELQRPLPRSVGLPTTPRPPAAPADPDDERHPADHPAARPADHLAPRTSGTDADAQPRPRPVPLTVPAPDLDRTALAAAGADVARTVSALAGGTPPTIDETDDAVLAVAATGALAARLPALSGVEGAASFGEPADELLHAYADLLVARAGARRTAAPVPREDLLAVVHAAAAAAAVGAPGNPALVLLAGMPAGAQLRAAAVLLAQTADDGGGAPDQLASEVGHLFGPQG